MNLDSILSTASVVVSFAIAYFLLNDYRFRQVKLFIEKLFWIDKLQVKRKKINALYFEAKLFMLFYLVLITQMLISNVFFFSLQRLAYSVISIVIYPLLYRLIMGIQRLIFRK